METTATADVSAAVTPYEWDLFISHASEDKDAFVRDLAAALNAAGCSVWYDEWTLTLGDRLRRRINDGLRRSRFGLVVLSHDFFAKNWPQDELDGLSALEMDGQDRILPVWLGLTRDDVARYSPMLAERLAADAALGIPRVVEEVQRALGRVPTIQPKSQSIRRAERKAIVDGFLRPRYLVGDEAARFGVNDDSRELHIRNESGDVDRAWAILSLVPVGIPEEIDEPELRRWIVGGTWAESHPLWGKDKRPRSGGLIIRSTGQRRHEERTRYTLVTGEGYVEWGRTLGYTFNDWERSDSFEALRLTPLLWAANELLVFLGELKEAFELRADYELVVSVARARGTILTHLGAGWAEPWDNFRDYRPACIDDHAQFRVPIPPGLGEEHRKEVIADLDEYLNGVWGAGGERRGHDHPKEGGALDARYRIDPFE